MEHVCIELPHRALQELGGALGSGFVMLLSDFRSKLGLEGLLTRSCLYKRRVAEPAKGVAHIKPVK